MRCPDCNRDFPVKPETVIQKEPCKCGLTEFARNFRIGAYVAILFILCAFGACYGDQYWTTRQVEIMREKFEIKDKKNSTGPAVEKLGLPYDVVPKK